MMNIADRKQATAPADAQRWLESFETALQAQDAAAVTALFLTDGLWRDVLAFTWTIQTMSGRPAIKAMLRETLALTKPKFHIPSKRTPPRWIIRAGTEAIEALFDFETAFGPANGVVRLVPDPQAPSQLRIWTLNTNLHELRGHEEEFKRRAPPDRARVTSAPTTGVTASPKRAPMPPTIPQSSLLAAARPAFPSLRACNSLGSTR